MNYLTNDSISSPLNSESVLKHKMAALRELAAAFVNELESLEGLRDLDLAQGIDMQREVVRYECLLIRRALRLTGGSQRKAAQLLGLNTSTLNDKIKRYGIIIERHTAEMEMLSTSGESAV
jgi:DNA-binding NtrC family response regulator